MQKLLVAPFDLHQRLLQLLERETENARRGLPARIIAKINSLAEPKVIEALYRASQAGVQIDLIVRGICCLRPGLKGLGQNITVRSVVDRFLEHSRIYYFENACQPEVLLASADWLPRSFFRRIEIAFPIQDGILRERVIRELLTIPLSDNSKARFLQPDGSYCRAAPAPGKESHRSQSEFMAQAMTGGEPPAKPLESPPRYPRVKLAPSPFAARKNKGG
jgi:polyphosphate kinase